jgi:hypothetical protein
MLMEWLELVLYVLIALVVWLGAAIALAQIEASEAGLPGPLPKTSQVADYGLKARGTGASGASAPRLYKDVEHDHRDLGDEDPVPYGLGYIGACQKCGARLFRARDGLRCPMCGLLAGRLSPPEPLLTDPKQWDPSILQPGPGFTKHIFDKVRRGVARPRIAGRRDGIQLSDEANAELLKKIFGEK